ncbi:hypothetical protein [Chitinophaga sp. LS1]|uniref:hypothetical protein n=1 Tax=Chitinophaga sp. LS1 TaxID=3051176 RepID=UPI002AAA6E4E|nr:hypothetical protein [Chitinophaga sp. LS1]WPV63920.1 hypothetical protein QQL36_19155 [Chitinophaga sp. LS1]
MSKYWFLFFCAGVWACNETPKDKKADVVSDSVTIAPNQNDSVITKPVVTEKQTGSNIVMECDQALNLMFQTSNYHPDDKTHLSDYKIHINEPGDADDPSIGIRIYYSPGRKDSSLAGVLNLDLQTGKLVDLSPQLDHPVELTYDSSYLNIIRKNCGNLPPGLF